MNSVKYVPSVVWLASDDGPDKLTCLAHFRLCLIILYIGSLIAIDVSYPTEANLVARKGVNILTELAYLI